MKAFVYHGGGERGALELEDVAKPTPNDGEVLIKVRAASVNPLDAHMRKHPFMRRLLSALSKSKSSRQSNRAGRDVAGEIEAVGRNVTEFKGGDAVFGLCSGSFAEYACAPHSAIVMKPANASFEQAAAVPLAALTALQGLRDKGKIQAGQKVLINGAAGGVGTFAVQIAKLFGAKVTGVCSARNVAMVHAIGADHVIDYTREDFTQGGQQYDMIFDLVANHSVSARRRVLQPKGIYVGAGVLGLGGSILRLLGHQLTELVSSRFASQQFVTLMAKLSKDDLVIMAELIEAGKVTPVIDKSYTLIETPEAVRYLEQGHAQGKVVITVEPNHHNLTTRRT